MMYCNVEVKANKKNVFLPKFLLVIAFYHNRNTKLKADTEGEGIGGANATKEY